MLGWRRRAVSEYILMYLYLSLWLGIEIINYCLICFKFINLNMLCKQSEDALHNIKKNVIYTIINRSVKQC